MTPTQTIATARQHLNAGLLANGAYTDLRTLLQLRFIAKDIQLSPQRDSRASLSGNVRTRFRGRGMDFEEVRVYQPGDDIRNIDWRVTARTQIPHTKLFREEKERPTFLTVDQRSSLFFGSQRCFKSVLCAHLASAIAWASLSHSDRVGGLIFGDKDHKDIRPRRSKHSVLELIHHLHDYNLQLNSPLPDNSQFSLKNLLEDTRRLAKPGSAVYLLSDCHDYSAACEEQLYQLSRHCDVTLFQVYDSLEQALPRQGLLNISNGHNRLQISAGDKQLNTEFNQRFLQKQQQLVQHCAKLKIACYSIGTHDDEIQFLRQTFRRGKRT